MAATSLEPGGHRDGVFGLARRDGRILMVRNPRVTRGETQSFWDLPGGAARGGETLPEALEREWAEETGLSAVVGDLLCVWDGSKRRPDGPLLYTWRAFLFEVQASGDPVPGAGIDAAEWVVEAEVAGRLQAPYHGVLRSVLAGSEARYAQTEWVEAAADSPGPAGRLPRDLLIIAAAGAVGDRATLRAQVERALAAGEGVARIEETLLQLVPYMGYPRAITAFGTVRSLLGDPGDGAGDDPSRPSGREVFGAVYGETAGEVRGSLEALHPLLARWTLDHAYGQVLARRPHLSLLERELLAVSILTAAGGLEEPLLGHMRAAVRLGADPSDVAGAVRAVPASMGEGRRAAAMGLLERL